jgi:hypothetical protein
MMGTEMTLVQFLLGKKNQCFVIGAQLVMVNKYLKICQQGKGQLFQLQLAFM